ncbi:DCC1-like thiol-disulfide oxidoreductase family protein [Parashewanella tropica]|uniref:DCC1-like thiol-disulfide oxidoreductase family protein n=1 Tax=Parashewanella tropica TaxID=2547970 RepID=UPI001059F33A|nr:DCC1-like thiol-disulfide oxidoreductase family protein [Parashewanella tropica]
MATSDQLEIIYDGDCPFCRNIVLKRDLESNGFQVTMVNARDLSNQQLTDYQNAGYDLNDGMLVKYQNKQYYGHDALMLLLKLSRHKGLAVRVFEFIYLKMNQYWFYRMLVKIRLWFVPPLK